MSYLVRVTALGHADLDLLISYFSKLTTPAPSP